MITWDDRDPPWINKTMKRLTQEKNDAYKCYINNNKNRNLVEESRFSQTKLNFSITTSKQKYHSRTPKN